MLSINEKITLRQLQALIIISAMGTGVIVLPRRAAEYAGSDGWMIVLGLVVLAMAIGALISTAARLRPADTFINSTGYFLSRPVAYTFGAVLWLKLVVTAGLELRIFMLVVQEVLLKHTPLSIVSITMLVISAYAAVKGIETRARLAEVLLALMILPFMALIVIALLDMDWSNLQPVFTTPPITLLEGSLRLGFMFTGLECLLLVSPYISEEKKMRKAVITSLGFAGIIITLITMLTMAKFGRGVADQPWPVLRMMDMLNLPGAFIERQEALVFSFWIITTFAFINALLFFGGVLIKDVFQPQKSTHHPSRANRIWQAGVLVTAFAVFIVSCISWDAHDIYRRLDAIYLYLGVFYLVILPVILILASKFRGSRNLALVILAVIVLGSLSGCWDKVELESRAFVVAIGVDKAESDEYKFTVTISIATNDHNNNEDDSEDKPQHIKKASAQTVTEAIKIINAETDKQLYFGQTKMLTLGNCLISNASLLQSALDSFNRHTEIDRAIYVLAAQNTAAEIIATKPQCEALPGQYVAAIYKDNRKVGGISFPMNLDKLLTQLKYAETALLPNLGAEDMRLSLSGAALLADTHKIGSLTNDELRGYLWSIDNGGQGAIVTAKLSQHTIPFKVEKHKASTYFIENGGKLTAHIKVELSGRIDEMPNLPVNTIKHNLEETVKNEILHTARKMQTEFSRDGYNWLDTMRKRQYPLYQRHAHNWKEVFPEIEVKPHVVITIKT